MGSNQEEIFKTIQFSKNVMKLGHEPFILYNNNEIDKNAISEYNLTHYFVGYLCQIQREASLKCRFSKLA